MRAESKNPAEAGFSEELKLTDKPHSFWNSVVGQSFILPPRSKNPAEAGFSEELKLTDKPGSVVGQSFI